MFSWTDPDRQILRLSGADVRPFLQGLVSNDIGKLDGGGLVYAALLSPQGKYLSDFFLRADGADVLLDVHAAQAEALVRRLTLYKLRAAVAISKEEMAVTLVWGAEALPGLADPRDPGLGTRLYGEAAPGQARPGSAAEYDALRVSLCVPAAGQELAVDESYILEHGFERLNGVDHRKGCYVGQEVTARMKHKTELRKGLVRVQVQGAAQPGDEVLSSDGRPAGTLHTVAGDHALAYLRFDRSDGALRAGEAVLTRI